MVNKINKTHLRHYKQFPFLITTPTVACVPTIVTGTAQGRMVGREEMSFVVSCDIGGYMLYVGLPLLFIVL
jgi:hypothetical protein